MRYLLLFALLILSFKTYAQPKPDTIFLFQKKIIGHVKEVREREIVYLHPNEALIYHVPKRGVLRIAFATGRQENFNNPKSYGVIKSSANWESVEITNNPYETDGMVKVADVISVKATGATVYSSVTNTQNRAFRKLRMAAAMLGGDVTLLLNQSVEGNIYDVRTTRTQIAAAVFRSHPLDTSGLHLAANNKTFIGSVKNVLRVNNAKIKILLFFGSLRFNTKSISIRNGIVYLTAPELTVSEEVNEFMLTYWDKGSIVLAYQKGSVFHELIFRR